MHGLNYLLVVLTLFELSFLIFGVHRVQSISITSIYNHFLQYLPSYSSNIHLVPLVVS
jgi:hypothetical protein